MANSVPHQADWLKPVMDNFNYTWQQVEQLNEQGRTLPRWERIKVFQGLIEEAAGQAVKDARSMLRQSKAIQLLSSTAQRWADRLDRWKGRLTAFGIAMSVSKVALATDKGREAVKEIAPYLLDFALKRLGAAAAGAVCGPAAPACSFAFLIGPPIAAYLLKEPTKKFFDQAAGDVAQSSWEKAVQFFDDWGQKP